jgi:hypothetical protein
MRAKKLLEEILTYIARVKGGLELHLEVVNSNNFDLEKFLIEFKVEECTNNELIKIDRLCKKIDVAKKLKRNYQLDLSKPINEEPLKLLAFELFVLNIAYLTIKKSDYKLLNTLLKIHSKTLPDFDISNEIECIIESTSENLIGRAGQ